jgi:hypothetical protein
MLFECPVGLADHVVEERLHVAVGLEAHDIVGEQRAHQGPVLGQGDDKLRRRPGDVEKEAHLPPGAQPLQLRAQRDQVVVLDPDQVARLQQRRERLGEQAVHPVVSDAEAAVVGDKIRPVMAQRP